MMSYSVNLNVIFSSCATIIAAEKTNKTPWNLGFYDRTVPPGISVISNKVTTCPAAEKIPVSTHDHLADCERLTAMELRTRYPGEANSHRNMLNRRKAKGAVIHPEFKDFRSFFRHVGPKPTDGATLDRIDNNDPEYAPGKVRWADKRTQNSNKGDSLTFHDPETNEVYTTSRLTKLQGVAQSTIRKRFERGWSDAEIIEGRRYVVKPSGPPEPPQPVPERYRHSVEPRHSKYKPPNYYAALPRPKTAQEIMFEEARADVLREREENGGVDCLIVTPDEWIEIMEEAKHNSPEELVKLREKLDRTYRKKFWPMRRPHVEWKRIPPVQQAYLEEIDPEWVQQQKEKIAATAALVDML